MAEPLPLPAPFAGVVAVFDNEDDWRAAAHAAQVSQQWTIEAYSPVADEETLRQMRARSTQHPVRLWTLLGGLFGGTCAFCMTIWMSRNWPLVVGGKPIVSWPPFICICFEMTVLYASLACMISMFTYARIPHLTLPAAFRPEFGVDRFGLFLPCRRADAAMRRLWLSDFRPEHVYEVHNPHRGRLAMPVAGVEVGTPGERA